MGFMVLTSWWRGDDVQSADTLQSRYSSFEFQNEYMSEEGDRGKYFKEGLPALADNPIFGVGLNNWSYWISNKYSTKRR